MKCSLKCWRPRMSRYACCCTAPEDTVLSINLVSKKRYYQNNNNNGSTDRGRSQNPIISAKTTSHLRVSRNTDNSTLFESENGDFVKDFAMPPQHAGLSTNKNIKECNPKYSEKEYGAVNNCSIKSPEKNNFLMKLREMERKEGKEKPFSWRIIRDWEKGKGEKVLCERKKMLVFRDVGMDLDKPILSRDVFLVLKYFRYGIEFAVDNELERMLRYFNEHALNEMKIIQNSKLMRGPAVLSRKRSHMSREVSISGMPTPFPHLKAAKMHQFCVFSEEIEEKVKHLIGQDSVFGVQPYKSKKNVGPLRKKHFNEQDQQQLTVFSQFTFHKPAVVIYTQLGQKMGAQADLEWRRLAYETINPSLAEYFSKTNDRHGGRVLQGLEQHKDGLRQQVNLPTHGVRGYRMPISVFSLRSMDVYKYRWVHRLYVRRFAQSLYSTDGPFVESATDSNVRGLLVASSTFVGSKLLAPFYSGVGLRNYLSPHVMLVDHEGIVRWLSAGCPDEHEREYFPRLLRQLEEEYYQSRR